MRKKNIRILLISPFFYPHVGGSQQYMEELHYHLMQQNPNIKVDVITYMTNLSKDREEYRGFNIYRIPCLQILPGQFAIPDYFKLYKLIKSLFAKNKYDFVINNTRFFESAWWTPFIARYYRTKSILTDHCASHPVHQSPIVSFTAKYIDKIISPFFANLYHEVIVTNQATQAFIEKLGIQKSHVVYGGVDINYFHPQKNIFKKNIIISFVGRMIYSKGPQILLQTAINIIKSYKNVYFIFAGDGEMYKKLVEFSNKQIIFFGPLEKSHISELLSKTDILIHPSLHHEGFPNVLLEAGASQCAVIATNQGGTKEIIIDKKTGLIARPNKQDLTEKIKTLLNNKDIRMKLAKALRIRVETHHDWKRIVKTYQKHLQSLI